MAASTEHLGVIRYTISDSAGVALAVHVRTEFSDRPKAFHWEQADGTLGLGGRPAASLPLNGLHRLQRAVYLVEGEKKADELAKLNLIAVGTVTGALGTPEDDVLAVLAGPDVQPWPDDDDVGQAGTDRISAENPFHCPLGENPAP